MLCTGVVSILHLQTFSSFSKYCSSSGKRKSRMRCDERDLLEPVLNERFQFLGVIFKSVGLIINAFAPQRNRKTSRCTLKAHIKTVRARIKHTSCHDLGLCVYGSPDIASDLTALQRGRPAQRVSNSSKRVSCSGCSESPSKASVDAQLRRENNTI